MALVSQKFIASYTFRDSGGDDTVKTYVLQAADMTAALASAASLLAILKSVTNSKIDGYSVTQQFAEETPEAIADDTVRNSVQAVISVTLDGKPLDRGTITVPGPKNALFTAVTGAGSDVVNATATLVTNLVGAFKPGELAYLSDGENAADVPNTIGYRRTVYRKLAKSV